MSTNSFSPEELTILSQRNQELFVLDALTEQNQTLIKNKIQSNLEKTIQFANNELNRVFKQIELTNYQVGKGPTFIPTIQDDIFMVHFELNEKQGNHWILIPFSDITQWLNRDDSKTKEALEEELETFVKAVTPSLIENFLTPSVSKDSFVPSTFQWTTFPSSNETNPCSGALNWNQFMEFKEYQFKETTTSSTLRMYHVSDLTFTEKVYEQLLRGSESPKEEVKMSEKQPSVLNANVSAEEISSPVFSEIEDVTTTTNPLSVNILDNVPLEVSVVLGKTFMTVDEILNLSVGRVIPLDKYTTDALEIYVQGELVALGDPVTIEEKYGTKITKIGKLD